MESRYFATEIHNQFKRMKKILVLLALTSYTALHAEEKTGSDFDEEYEAFISDSTKYKTLDNVMVVASPKEHLTPRQQPVSVSLFSPEDLEDYRIQSLKNLSALVPSLFIPDYGSRITSAIYIRGVGSRINTPSVGLYVDNVPVLEKSAYDFDYSDVDRIDVLRGPQGTLYGRNTMGGLIKVYTKSPMNYQGTDFRASAGMYGQYSTSLTHYHRISDKFAFSAGGFYQYEQGFFKNVYLDRNADRGNSGGGRLRAIYHPAERWNLDFNVSYQYSDQLGYAYGIYDKETNETGDVSYNDESSYYRNLLSASLNAEYQAPRFTVNAVTGYQYLKDRMFMDQDYSPAAIFTLEQKQRMHAFSEEITLKSRGTSRWDWLFGAFGFYQGLKTSAPVTFKEDGVREQLEETINRLLPPSLGAQIDFVQPQLAVGADFDSPTFGLAAYHQSTFNNLLTQGLSLTLGLRLDYEKNKLDYSSESAFDYEFPVAAMGGRYDLGNSLRSVLEGSLDHDYVQLLPKLALSYYFNPRNLVYASVAKGYRSGGYNIQMISDLASNQMQVGLTDQLRNDLRETMIEAGAPEHVANAIAERIPSFAQMDAGESLTYKPEFCWNYEIGTHLTLMQDKLWADASCFYIDTRDQQIARFVDSGLGRRVVNAGRSESYGGELSLRAKLFQDLTASAGYGYTHATFKDHLVKNAAEGEAAIDYRGNYVPYIPKHTVNIGLRYDIRCAPWSWFDNAWVSVNYHGAGRIYWTEKNDAWQNYYGLVNWNLSATAGIAEITLWSRNFLDTEYNTFCFNNSTTQDKFLGQKGKPFQLGVDLRLRF